MAEGLRDGENHPELYFVDKGNSVRNFTAGSSCWDLNFTEFMGKRIYYGCVYSEAPMKEVVFKYNGAIESTAPHSPGVIAVKDASEETADFIKNVQGYLLITDNKGIPASFGLNNEDGKSTDYISDMLQGMSIPPYMDVEDPSIRYTSLYQYNPMTGTEEVSAGEKIGLISLQHGENELPLDFAGFFKDVSPQEIFKSLSVYALCSNILYEGQRLPAGGTVSLAFEKGLLEDAEIRCYFSPLTKDSWDVYKKTGSLDFSMPVKKPDEQGSIELGQRGILHYCGMY